MDKNTNTLTVLLDDTAHIMGLRAEHGLCYLLEKDGHAALFDTGQSGLLLQNTKPLEKDLSRVEAIVLSHGHYDHTGGLMETLRIAESATVYAHPDVFLKRYAKRDTGEVVSVGIRFTRDEIEAAAPVVTSCGPVEIIPGIRTTGQIARTAGFEDTGGPFFLDASCTEEDNLPDDMAVFFEADDGTVVILGCAHAGVINTLERVAELTGRRQIHTVIGGMHLGTASEERMDRTCEGLRSFGVERLGLAHCTGTLATVRFFTEFPDRCFICATGTSVAF